MREASGFDGRARLGRNRAEREDALGAMSEKEALMANTNPGSCGRSAEQKPVRVGSDQSRRADRGLLTSGMTVNEQCASSSAARVKARGWALARSGGGSHELRSMLETVARQFGTPLAGREGRSMDRLSPRSQGEAHPKSLSAIHGAGVFPLHTDGAHLAKPPRFILLACQAAGSSPVPTVLARYDSLGLAERTACNLSAAPFLVSNGRRSFYATICGEREMCVRYDRGCMRPASPQSAELAVLFEDALRHAPVHTHHWVAGDILVVDNWRVLHGRGLGAGMPSSDRALLRVAIQ